MNKHLSFVIASIALLLASPGSSAGYSVHKTSGSEASGPRFIVHASAMTAYSIAAQHGLTIEQQVWTHNICLVTAPAGADVNAVEAELQSDASIPAFEPDGQGTLPEVSSTQLTQSTVSILDAIANRAIVTYFGASVPNYYSSQPATRIIRLRQAQDQFGAVGSGIVAIIDTGIDPTHPAFGGHLIDGYDFTRDLPGLPSEMADLAQSTVSILDQSTVSILDSNQVTVLNGSVAAILSQSTVSILDSTQIPAAFGHGTMVAGIVHLVAPNAQILPLKAFNADGTSSTFDIIRAIYYAVDHGAKVINMSFSMDQPSPELIRAINYADRNGVICVSSAGNSGRETVVYPAAMQNVIGVASTDNLDQRSLFSNFGTSVADMAAPGEVIVTTYPGSSYAAASGTSFSTPLVSGTVSLLLQFKPSMKRPRIENALSKAADVADELGWGRLDVMQSLNQ